MLRRKDEPQGGRPLGLSGDAGLEVPSGWKGARGGEGRALAHQEDELLALRMPLKEEAQKEEYYRLLQGWPFETTAAAWKVGGRKDKKRAVRDCSSITAHT